MEEERIVTGEDAAGNEQYIAAINELKANTVSKDAFLKLKQENKQLLDSLVNGQSIEQKVEAPKQSIDSLKKHLQEEGLSNLDYVSTSLELRNRVLAEQGIDMYCPNGAKYVSTYDDQMAAQRVAEQFQEMVDLADGDSNVFDNEFQRRVKDIPLPRRNH
jgi:hypothetical protein